MTSLPTPLKVAVDARSLLCREPRGEGKSLLRLYQEIHALSPDIQVVFFGDHTTRHFTGELPPNVAVRSADVPGARFNSWENLYFPLAARMLGCNVMHCTSSGAPIITAMPMLLTVHDLIPMLFDDGQSVRDKIAFETRLRHGLRQARRIIAVSAHTQQDIGRNFPALRTSIDVVHWGADPHAVTTQRSSAATAPSKYVLAFGGRARRKNTDYAVARFLAIAPRLPDVRLALVGVSDEHQRQHIAETLDRAGMTARVDLHRFITEEALDDLLEHAAVLLYPSLYEGFGLPPLEAIARGVPVVASDRSSIPEVLGGAPGCFSLDDPDAIESALLSLLADPAVRADWISAQQSELTRFSWAVAAASTVDLLAGTLRASRR